MLTHIGSSAPLWSRLLRWMILLTILAAVVGSGLYLLRRGRGRTDLFQAAMEALARGDHETAENHLRTLLESGTRRRDVATKLMGILLEGGRYEEAAVYAERWRSQPHLAAVGWRAAIEIALRQLHLVDAERLAREQGDLDPEFAQFTILRVQDLLGSFQNRWAAQRAAVAMATLTLSEEVRTRTFLFAAETLRDLLVQAKDELKDAVRGAYRLAALEARVGLHRLRDITTLPEVTTLAALQGRVALLSEEPRERREAEKALRALLREDKRRYEVAASLQAYAASREEWGDAVQYAKALSEGPLLLWLRAVQRLLIRGQYADVLEVIEGSPHRTIPLAVLHEARARLASDDAASRSIALGQLEELVRREDLHQGTALAACQMLVEVGRMPENLDVLARSAQDTGDPRGLAVVAALLSAAGETEDARALAHDIAGHLETLPQGLGVLAVLGRGDAELLDAYLRAPIDVSAPSAGRSLYLRATAAAAQASLGAPAPVISPLRAAARRDLAALAQVDAAKADLAEAWQLALGLSEPHLVGRLAGRAILLSGPPHSIPFSLLSWAAITSNAETRREVAVGLRSQAEGTRHGAFLETLADLVIQGHSEPARIIEALMPLTEGADALEPAVYLRAHASLLGGDVEAGELLARELREANPASQGARDLLGAFLLRRDAWQETVDLHEESTARTLASYHQMVVALQQISAEASEVADSKGHSEAHEASATAQAASDRALALARRAVREYPGAADAYILLAGVLWQPGNVKKSLGVLSIAPPTPAVSVLRARLLAQDGETAVAESLLRETLAAHPGDIGTWRRLYLLMSSTGARGRLADAVSEALKNSAKSGSTSLRAELHLLRGMAELGRGEEDRALRDFERVIELRPNDSVALNNAAWIIVEYQPERLARAAEYVARALAAMPSNGDIHDTAAIIHLRMAERGAGAAGHAQGELERALAFADRAVALSRAAEDEAARGVRAGEADAARDAVAKPSFRLHRALILDRLGRRGDAIQELEAVEERFPDALPGVRAAGILRKWARESG